MNFNIARVSAQVIMVCKQAGLFLKREFLHFDSSKIEYKGLNDLVSYVDKQAEQILVEGLQVILPEAGFITEEATLGSFSFDNIPTEGFYWIIDPLDGTTNFTHGLPVFAVSVALWKDGELIIGVIYEPNRDECFSAYKGNGAFLNDSPIKVQERALISEALLATGFPYQEFDKMENYLSILADLMKSSHGLRRMGSAAVDLAYVACGRFDGFFEYNLKPWDVAAGILIVQEAGGKVYDFSGGDNYLFGKQIIAAGGIEKALLEQINMHWNKK